MDDLGLLIRAILDPNSTKDIKTQIENLQTLFEKQPIKIKLDIDNAEFKAFSNNLQKMTTNMNKSLGLDVDTNGLDKFTAKFKTLEGKSRIPTEEIKEFTNNLGQSIKEVDILGEKIDELGKKTYQAVQTNTTITDNYKQQRLEAQRVSDTIQNQIKLLQTRVQLLKQNYWTGDTAQIDNFSNKLNANNISPTNAKAEIANLKNEYQLIANTMQESHRNNLANLQTEIQLEEQKSSSVIENWKMRLASEEKEGKLASDRIKNQMLENAQLDKQTAELQTQLDLYKKKMLGDDTFTGEIDIFASKQNGKYDKDALTQIKNDIKALNVDTPELNTKIKQTGIEFSSLKQQAAQSGNVMTRALDNAMKFLRFYLVGGILVGFVKAIKDSVEVVRELDTSLTELNKVSDLTSSQLQDVTNRAFEMGSAIGRTGKEFIDATAEWVRAGYAVEEAMALSNDSLILTNIGDGITDVKEASSSLIAILKGFNLEASKTTYVVDALNEVSNKFAVDTNNLTEIMKRASGTISQTGSSYEELLGLATGGYESLRNAEMVASGKFCPYVQKCA